MDRGKGRGKKSNKPNKSVQQSASSKRAQEEKEKKEILERDRAYSIELSKAPEKAKVIDARVVKIVKTKMELQPGKYDYKKLYRDQMNLEREAFREKNPSLFRRIGTYISAANKGMTIDDYEETLRGELVDVAIENAGEVEKATQKIDETKQKEIEAVKEVKKADSNLKLVQSIKQTADPVDPVEKFFMDEDEKKTKKILKQKQKEREEASRAALRALMEAEEKEKDLEESILDVIDATPETSQLPQIPIILEHVDPQLVHNTIEDNQRMLEADRVRREQQKSAVDLHREIQQELTYENKLNPEEEAQIQKAMKIQKQIYMESLAQEAAKQIEDLPPEEQVKAIENFQQNIPKIEKEINKIIKANSSSAEAYSSSLDLSSDSEPEEKIVVVADEPSEEEQLRFINKLRQAERMAQINPEYNELPVLPINIYSEESSESEPYDIFKSRSRSSSKSRTRSTDDESESQHDYSSRDDSDIADLLIDDLTVQDIEDYENAPVGLQHLTPKMIQIKGKRNEGEKLPKQRRADAFTENRPGESIADQIRRIQQTQRAIKKADPIAKEILEHNERLQEMKLDRAIRQRMVRDTQQQAENEINEANRKKLDNMSAWERIQKGLNELMKRDKEISSEEEVLSGTYPVGTERGDVIFPDNGRGVFPLDPDDIESESIDINDPEPGYYDRFMNYISSRNKPIPIDDEPIVIDDDDDDNGILKKYGRVATGLATVKDWSSKFFNLFPSGSQITDNIESLINSHGTYIAGGLLAAALLGIGTYGAVKLYNYLFPSKPEMGTQVPTDKDISECDKKLLEELMKKPPTKPGMKEIDHSRYIKNKIDKMLQAKIDYNWDWEGYQRNRLPSAIRKGY